MNPLIQGLMVLVASYLTVLLLGFQSKLMRDNRWQLSFFMTWMITFAQVATTWSIANNHLGMPLLVFLSGLGGSLGIVSSHFLYLWYDGRKNASPPVVIVDKPRGATRNDDTPGKLVPSYVSD